MKGMYVISQKDIITSPEKPDQPRISRPSAMMPAPTPMSPVR